MREPSSNTLLGILSTNKIPKIVLELVVEPPSGASETLVFMTGPDSEIDGGTGWNVGIISEATIQGLTIGGQRVDGSKFSSTIGGSTAILVDVDASVVARLAQQNELGREISKGTLTAWLGFDVWNDGVFAKSEFDPLFAQRVQTIDVDGSKVTIRTQDLQREARKRVFQTAKVRLASAISATATTIGADAAIDGFVPVIHGAWYSDAPSSTVGYFRIEDEVVRYTGKVGQDFTGCTRGALGTRAVAHSFSGSEPPTIEEFVYLEGSALAVARAILTGQMDGTNVVPDSWNAGIDPADLSTEWAAASVGADVYDETDPSAGPQVRLWGIDGTEAKAFVEKELYPIAGVFTPVLSDGKLGLRRVNSILVDAPVDLSLDETDLLTVSALKYEPDKVRNRYRIEWSVDVEGEIRRVNEFIDSDSIARYGEKPTITLRLPALHGSKTSRASLVAIKNTLRERLSQAPLRMQVSAKRYGLLLEAGDTVRISNSSVRDPVAPYIDATTAPTVNRSFEVEGATFDVLRMKQTLQLVTASRRPPPIADCDEAAALQDDFYDATGTDLDSLSEVSSGVMDTVTLTGSAAVGGAVYYHLGDLEIRSGATVTIEDNVELRIQGTLTVDGAIVGTGNGRAGGSDGGPNNVFVAYNSSVPGATFTNAPPAPAGYLGRIQGGAGVIDNSSGVRPSSAGNVVEYPALRGGSRRTGIEEFRIVNNATSLEGLPTDLRGSPGAPGQRGYEDELDGGVTPGYRQFVGGAGGDGAAGLVIVCRGMVMGIGGSIELDGSGGTVSPAIVAGGGAGGGPGALLVLLDGVLVAIPTFTTGAGGNFSATQGNNAVNRPEFRQNLSDTAFRVQFIPCNEPPTPDPDPIARPFLFTADLSGQPSSPALQSTQTHVTVSGELDIVANYIHTGPTTPTAIDQDLTLLVERKLSSEAVGAFVTVEGFGEGTRGYSRRTLNSGAIVDEISVTLTEKGLAPGSYDYRFTWAYYETTGDPATRALATHVTASTRLESFER